MIEAKPNADAPLIEGNKSLAQVTADVCAPLEGRAGLLWWTAFLVSLSVLLVGIVAVTYQTFTGIGTWGLNRTVGWAFDITNFVFWIGIGHAGTLISAILFLFRQRWRNSVNRSAEAMTLFAVICAGIFPIIHMGRPWLFYWFIPYPNDRGPLWINFRSPLVWDFVAISTYFLISLVFWYVGLIPDLATLRDRVKPGWYRRFMGFFSLGWNGSGRTWHRYETVYLILAGIATPLVVSVHSVVSSDFAVTVLPGWHTTLFPPYFVAGAIFSGLSMVLTLMLIARKTMRLEAYITSRHVDAMTKLVLATSGMVGLAYVTEIFTALYTGNNYEHLALINRLQGPLAWGYWLMVACNVVIPQLFWFKRIRFCLPLVFIICILVNVGMWFERFIIIVTGLERDFLPSSWANYAPTIIELATLAGSFGLFFTCFLLFCRVLPAIAIAEVKGILEPGKETGTQEDKKTEKKAVQDEAAYFPLSASPTLVRGIFEKEEDVLKAAEAAKRDGWQIVDIHSPFPLHGTAKTLGLARSRLPRAAFAFGLLGVVLALWFQYWVSAQDWPINVGGRPWNSLPAFVPIAFELMVLFAGFGIVLAFFYVSRLFPGKKAVLASPRVSDDHFVLEAVPVADRERIRRLFTDCHAIDVQEGEVV